MPLKANLAQSTGFSGFFVCLGVTGNRRFWAASPTRPRGGLGEASAGALSICIDLQFGRPPSLRQLREVF